MSSQSPAKRPVPSRRRSVRGRRLLWRWRHLLLAVAVVSGAWMVVREVRPPDPPSVEVLVLARDVPAGARLGGADLRTVPLPTALGGAAMARPDAIGERIAVGLPAGFPLTPELLVGPGLASGVPPGEVVVPVRLADATVARSLRPGDRIDLLAADAAVSAAGARVVAADALVVAREEGGDGGLLGGEEPSSLVFVSLPRGTAPAVVGASAWAPLRVVLPG